MTIWRSCRLPGLDDTKASEKEPSVHRPSSRQVLQVVDKHRKLGSGHFGDVYMGSFRGAPAAIKTLDISGLHNVADQKAARALEAKRDSFLWEGRRLLSVSHPYIVGLLCEPVQMDDELLLVLEFCSGGNVEQALSSPQHPVHSLQRQWRLLVELTSALGAIHQQGMVHKDIKSENLLLTSDGHLKVADLGVSPLDPMLLLQRQETVADVVRRGLKDRYWASPEEARKEPGENSSACAIV